MTARGLLVVVQAGLGLLSHPPYAELSQGVDSLVSFQFYKHITGSFCSKSSRSLLHCRPCLVA